MTQGGKIVDDQGKLNNFAVEPKMYVDDQGSRVGFTAYAEKVNGRLAMLGFVSMLLLEGLLGKGLLDIFNF